MRIGVFDSGLGGLTVLRELHQVLPHAQYFYLGDSARSPYGTKSAETVRSYARECAEFLFGYDLDALVVACNTASALALGDLQENSAIPVFGTIDPAVKACISYAGAGPVGVIGTRATIGSGAYQSAIESAAPQLEVLAAACPLFVPLVEEGIFSGPLVQQAIEMYLAPLRARRPQALILGCTHYPLLTTSLSTFFGEHTRIIECSRVVAWQVSEALGGRSAATGSAQTHYFVTDEVDRFNALGTLLLGGREVNAVIGILHKH